MSIQSSTSQREAFAARFRKSVWLPLSLALAAGFVLVGWSADVPEVSAAPGGNLEDSDDDGLTDHQEEILGTHTEIRDTDGDGFDDLEEIARQSDPLSFASRPVRSRPLSVGVTGRAVEGVFTAVTPIYVQGGTLGGLNYEFGLVLPGGTRIPIPFDFYLPVTRVDMRQGAVAADRVLLIEVRFPASVIQTYGNLAIYAKLTNPGGTGPLAESASVINVVDFDGVPMIVQAQNSEETDHLDYAITYRPLVPDEAVPAAWAVGQLCLRQTRPVGMVGSSTAFEVTHAGCIAGDTFCEFVACSASVGTSVEIVDPSTLLGG